MNLSKKCLRYNLPHVVNNTPKIVTDKICIWSEPSVRRISTSVSIVCTVVAEQTDPRCTLSSADTTHKGDSV